MTTTDMRRLIPVVYISVNGVFQPGPGHIPEYAWDAEGEIIEAVGEAIRLAECDLDSVVSLVVGFVPEGSQ